MKRIEAVAASGVSAVILREKDLSPADYAALFARVLALCERRGVLLIAHGLANAPLCAGAGGLHLSFADCAGLGAAKGEGIPRRGASRAGVSVHSADEARRARLCGASYLVAGHIFQTESKAARAPRGLAFLRDICACLPLPVYAIGGVSEQNIASVKEAGAAGACLMSSFMTCPDPAAHARALLRGLNGGAGSSSL